MIAQDIDCPVHLPKEWCSDSYTRLREMCWTINRQARVCYLMKYPGLSIQGFCTMMEVRPVHAFEDNYIWVIGCQGRPEVAIVDPGDAEPVQQYIEQQGLQPVAILITHHHGDHTAGIEDLLSHYNIPVYGPANEKIRGLSHPLQEGAVVELPGCDLRFEVLDTPGHTRGHICYVGEGALFCGDTLFAAGCGRLFEGTAEHMHASLEKIRALPDDTLVYCAHEYTQANLRFARIAEPSNPETMARAEEVSRLRAQGQDTVPSLLGREKATNPFLRSHHPELRQAAEAWAGTPLSGAADVFGVVRRWKDALD